MLEKKPEPIYLKNYKPSDFLAERINLRFELGETSTEVQASMRLYRNPASTTAAPVLHLDGQALELLDIRLNGQPLDVSEYHVESDYLTVLQPPASFELDVTTRIYPQNNTSLEGLYRSAGLYCTQCEAEGFRKISYFLDRPDVMTVYTTTIVADKINYPVLLANGNLIASGELDDGRHWATWHDPFNKPTYLFALVAGRLAFVEDTFTTRSGRAVTLRIYVEPDNIDQCDHALRSLKKAMAWDEQRFGLEYDLDIYMIVAVSDFNFGAMENKGLNIFNTKYVLAKPATATDIDYQAIEAVIAHEYFHNWTGNRVTCRDWFQLSLKEGLTVFRDQEFSADMGSRGVKRISDVRGLRSTQFPEDAGPMAHPVRPDSYIEINNFYTTTVYNKGAEVVRMMHKLLGETGFRKGMKLYFQRHDGAAVTCDDFVSSMEDANGVDLGQFRRWYDQAGTPRVAVSGQYDRNKQSYTLELRQACPATPGQPEKQPFHIPIAMGLLDRAGNDIPLQLESENAPTAETRVLELRESAQCFCFINVREQPIPSLLRDFSAPVQLTLDYTDEDLMFLLANDNDDFNRWEAGQTLAQRVILNLVEQRRRGQTWSMPERFIAVFNEVLTATGADPALQAQILQMPGETYLAEQMDMIDVEGIHEARNYVRRSLAEQLQDSWLAVFRNSQTTGYQITPADMGRRSLKNLCLDYLLQLNNRTVIDIALQQLNGSANMTDQIGALQPLAHCDFPERENVFSSCYQRWRHEPLVIDKWFALQASSSLPNTLATVKSLLKHPAFNIKNPNKVRALLGSFCQANAVRFHAPDGAAYTFIADQIALLNAINPQLAARLVGAFTRWRRYDPKRQQLMRCELERIQAIDDLSPDVYEIVAKSLAEDHSK